MTRLPVSFAAAIAALALTLLQASVLATPVSHDTRAVEVAYGDLDLDDSSDAATLYGRLTAAAREACAAADTGAVRPDELVRECVARAVADAVSRIRSEPLTALHRAHRLSPARG
jgi:UrcA family protein